MSGDRLPAAVRDLALRLGARPEDDRATVSLTQRGRMKRKLGTEAWMDFTATQTMATQRCAFDWLAKAGPFGMISARDALDHGEGRLDVTALGVIPIARTAHTAALVRGELMRYLAEIAFAPTAILRNASLTWREAGPDSLAVSAGQGDIASEVVLSLDRDGLIIGADAPDRPRSAVAPTLPTAWSGRFSDYRQHLGFWIPFAGEVAWHIDGVREVYWQGAVETWEIG